MTTNTNTAGPTAAQAVEVTSRLARTIAQRVAQTGETFEVATNRVLVDFTTTWPTVAAWVAAVTVEQARTAEVA